MCRKGSANVRGERGNRALLSSRPGLGPKRCGEPQAPQCCEQLQNSQFSVCANTRAHIPHTRARSVTASRAGCE